jgi:hypothetical protein
LTLDGDAVTDAAESSDVGADANWLEGLPLESPVDPSPDAEPQAAVDPQPDMPLEAPLQGAVSDAANLDAQAVGPEDPMLPVSDEDPEVA